MATYQKRNERWRAIVRKKGVHQSRTFYAKAKAKAWAEDLEHQIEDGEYGNVPDKIFSDLLDKYAENVTIHKRTSKREQNRILALQRDRLSDTRLCDLSAPDISDWRDRRLQVVSAASVIRDWNLLNHACNLAVKEWHWLKTNPMIAVKKPAKPAPRNRTITDDEVKMLLENCGHPGDTVLSRVGDVLLFALETAMRSGEICQLTWEHVHDRHVHIPTSKNGRARDVPLSTKAQSLIQRQSKQDPVFSITTSQLDALFRKCRDRLLIVNLHFHDSRRTALTRLAKIYSVMDLAKISGHLDLRILQQVYYAPSIDDLADKLD